MFDDYFVFSIDGNWVAINNTYQNERSFTTSVTEGWHRFTIVCGDTWGGQGGTLSPGNVPMLISIEGGSEIQFSTANFTMGTEQSETLTLAADCDWSALGNIALNNSATLDLNGHNLKVAGITVGGFLGAKIVNNSETLSTLTVTNASGTTALDGVAVQGNIAIVKKGAGAMGGTPSEASGSPHRQDGMFPECNESALGKPPSRWRMWQGHLTGKTGTPHDLHDAFSPKCEIADR